MNRYRAIFLSDFHLGTIGCRSASLLSFLQSHNSDVIYLIGDIVDTWTKRAWTQEHLNILRWIAQRADMGSKVYYLPGNHDNFARDYPQPDFGNIHIANSAIHVLANGAKMLVIHGDEQDDALRLLPWLSRRAASVYERLLSINNNINSFLGRNESNSVSLFSFLKKGVKHYLTKSARFEKRLTEMAGNLGYSGVICGHMHEPALKMVNGLLYANAGDWVENCSALVEHFDGRLEILTSLSPNSLAAVDHFAAAVVS